jgi:hypothetical protein
VVLAAKWQSLHVNHQDSYKAITLQIQQEAIFIYFLVDGVMRKKFMFLCVPKV